MDGNQSPQTLLDCLGQSVIRGGHVGELRVTTGARQGDRVQNRRFRGTHVIGMIGVPALPWNIAASVRELVLVRDVMNFRTVRKRESRVMLRKNIPKHADGIEHLVR